VHGKLTTADSDYNPGSSRDEPLPSSQATVPDSRSSPPPRTPHRHPTPDDKAASRQLHAIEAKLSQIDNTLRKVDVNVLSNAALGLREEEEGSAADDTGEDVEEDVDIGEEVYEEDAQEEEEDEGDAQE
jgi:hypothetical protein